jgi:hypothetical protein
MIEQGGDYHHSQDAEKRILNGKSQMANGKSPVVFPSAICHFTFRPPFFSGLPPSQVGHWRGRKTPHYKNVATAVEIVDGR